MRETTFVFVFQRAITALLFALFAAGSLSACADDDNQEIVCDDGSTSDECKVELNGCDDAPCANGTCTDQGEGKYLCECAEGWEGDQCDQATDGCQGEDCEEPVPGCEENPCLNGGTCTDQGEGTYLCECAEGWEGDTCDKEIDDCQGEDCEEPVDACLPNPCQNGGECSSTGPGTYECACDEEHYTGDNCELAVDGSCDGFDDCPGDEICRENLCIPHDPNASSAADILSFSLRNISVIAPPGGSAPVLIGTIDDNENMIGIYGEGLNISNTRPTIEISEGASISPAASVPQNFTQPVEYTVTAEDGTKRVYTVDDIDQLHNFEIKKGFNIASWLYNPKPTPANRAAFFNKNDIQYLKELGFDHIRINIDEDIIWDDDGNKIRAHGWDLLHDAIQWSQRSGMRVLVDLHTTRNHKFTVTNNALFEGGQAEVDYFVDLWMQFSEELSGYSNAMVAYELLNEPIAVEPLDWNGVADATIAAIRAVEPDRTIVVGVASSRGQAASYDKLQITSRHKILTTFHFYSPSVFTLFRMPGTVAAGNPNIGPDFPISYPGQLVPDTHLWVFPEGWIREKFRRNINKAWLADGIQQGLDMADRLNLPVFVGEFGVLNTIEDDSRIRWIEDVVDILNEAGDIPYTYFDFKGYGFSLFNDDGTIKYPDLIDVIR